ncbi:MAG TPA: response regulator [Armatimonadota bacterium]|jgi:YesN/AraC family two-component response regulator
MPADHDNENRYQVMSVDDEPIVHKMLAQIIGDSDLPLALVDTALSGSEALKKAPEIRPHIFIVDIHMEDIDGLELVDRLQALLDYRPHFIYLSAFNNFEYAQRALHLGAVEYLLKPINREELLAAFKRAINALQAERVKRLELEHLQGRLASLLPQLGIDAERPRESRNAALARAVRQYVEEHYCERISLASVADHLQLSPGYLGSLFKQESGVAFRAFLRAVRITHAKEMMSDPRFNLTEVARAVGYDDLNYFSQAFLEESGMRPSEYRGEGRRWAK